MFNLSNTTKFVLTAGVICVLLATSLHLLNRDKNQTNKKGEVEITQVEVEAPKFVEGEHYVKVNKIQGLPQNSVMEILWYGCTFCYRMEELVQSDEFKEKTKHWEFSQVHVAGRGGDVLFDFKVFSALNQLGVEHLVGKKYMKALHEEGLDRKDFPLFAKKNGLSMTALSPLFENEETKSLHAYVSKISEQKEFKGVPSFLVKGEYLINIKYDIVEIANYLLAMPSEEKPNVQDNGMEAVKKADG